MELKNFNLYEIKEVISRVSKYGSNKFKIKLMLNEELVNSRIETLEKLKEFSDGFKEYQQKYQEMALKYSEIDENGQPVLYNGPNGTGGVRNDGSGIPNIIKDVEEHDKLRIELEGQYAEDIELANQSNTKFNKTIVEDVDPDMGFYKIDSDILPEVNDDSWYEYIKVLKPLINFE